MLKPVFIRKKKRPEGSGFWGAYPTADDEFGVWLFTPRCSLYRGESGGSVGYCNVASPPGPGIPVIHIVPHGWWIATFWAPGWAPGEADWSVTFDISTPPRLVAAAWTYVDLEPDLSVDGATRQVHLKDEDEFQAAVPLAVISPDEAAEARRAVDEIGKLMWLPTAALADAGAARLADALNLGLAPIRQLA